MRALPLGALSSVSFAALTLGLAAPAAAQNTTSPQSPVAQECNPDSPTYDRNTGNCVQAPEGTAPGTAPGTNPGTAPSDEAAPADEEAEVIVTGSRIPRPQFEGTIPGAQVTREQIESRAFTNTLDVLNDLPLVGPGASPFGTNGGQPASLGAAFVDLLDLGTNRTLTLVNGRRYVSGNAASLFVAGNVTGSQVDLNTIPTALISRLDVLTVGGAVAYGSDAIAGVVNAILRDDYNGVEISGLSGITERGDGATWRLTGLAGTNFLGDRGNITVSLEVNHDDALTGDRRPEIAANFIAPTSFRQGSVRNPNFQGVIGLPGANAFLPTASDLVPNNIASPGFTGGSILQAESGAIFQANASILNPSVLPVGFQGIATTNPQTAPSFRPGVLINQAGNVNLVPGTPIATGNGCSITNLTSFCNFAPSSLPAGTAAQQATFVNAVIGRFAPTQTGGTVAERNALALQLLQANLQTPREFLIANPNTDINAFIGTTIPNFLDVANTGPNASVLPRIAAPLQFDAAGNIISIVPAVISDPRVTPSTTGGATTPNGFNPARYTNLRVEQRRYIGNLFAHFDVADWLTVYTENQFARVENESPRNSASFNGITAGTPENAALVLNIANPFLDAADRAALTAAGVTGPFVLSRTNQDIVGDNPTRVNSDTLRTVWGLKGDFGLFGRNLNWDTSVGYGRSKAVGESFQIKDIEYALALDAVVNPANGQIVCRAQLNPSAFIGTTPQGVVGQELIRRPGADGVIQEQFLRRTITAEQIAACQPLNPFGFNQLSSAAREYVRAETGFENLSEQHFAQASLAGSLVDLPAGPFGFAVTAEYRRDSLDYTPDALSAQGATRTAALAATEGFIENLEFGGEVRIPIFGTDFNVPLFRNLELTPGIRYVRQTGKAPAVRLLDTNPADNVPGRLIENESEGDWNRIYSLAGTWRPIRDVSFRANATRSIRQPSIVELFLGGQPAFTTAADPCSPANIGAGQRPAVRRANCVAAVIASGLATDAAGATAFLNTYVPSGTGISGTFSGSADLLPERGKSWTIGGVLSPSFLPGFQFSADYIDVEVQDQIIPTQIGTALSVCFDSPNFPDTSSEVGVNVCEFFRRIPATAAERRFEVDNGFASGFINLGALKVKAINMTAQYNFGLERLLGRNAGNIELFSNVYHVVNYLNAPDGNLANGQETAGTFGRPKWEVQGRVRYENGGFYGQWVTFWQPKTKILSGGVPIDIEVQDLLGNPAFALHDATIGYSFGERQRFGMQLAIRNVLDKRYAGRVEQVFGLGTGRIDDFGRRFTISANAKF